VLRVQEARLELVEKDSRISQLQLQIESDSLPYKKKAELVDEYKKKVGAQVYI
jgi:hypothetical protein